MKDPRKSPIDIIAHGAIDKLFAKLSKTMIGKVILFFIFMMPLSIFILMIVLVAVSCKG